MGGMGRVSWIVALVVLAPLACAQKVMSARAGMIYFSEGRVTLDGKALRDGSYERPPQIQDGQTFGAARGHAEVLMGPGATMWTAPGSSVRFDVTDPGAPEVTLLGGAAIFEVHKAQDGTQYHVHLGDQVAEFGREGVYRFESLNVRVYAGEATIAGARLARGQEWAAGVMRDFDRKQRDPFLYFAAYRSYQLETEAGSFRTWRAHDFTNRAHSGFDIDFPQAPGAARVKYMAGGEAGLVNYLEGSAITGGRSPINTNRLPFRLGEENYLRTDRGRAEVFLGVGVVARMAQNTQLRMVDTRPLRPMIAIDKGLASIEIASSSDDPVLRVRVGDSITELSKPGVYQFDAESGSLQVFGGEASTVISDATIRARQAQQVNLREAASVGKFDAKQQNALLKWTADRSFQLYLSSAAFMTAWQPMTEPGKVQHKFFGKRVDLRPQARRRRPRL